MLQSIWPDLYNLSTSHVPQKSWQKTQAMSEKDERNRYNVQNSKRVKTSQPSIALRAAVQRDPWFPLRTRYKVNLGSPTQSLWADHGTLKAVGRPEGHATYWEPVTDWTVHKHLEGD